MLGFVRRFRGGCGELPLGLTCTTGPLVPPSPPPPPPFVLLKETRRVEVPASLLRVEGLRLRVEGLPPSLPPPLHPSLPQQEASPQQTVLYP